tara:strand:+ start:413 stop:634 length:222 start_codon:yes stop_codon:yes gene_type:complete
MQENKAKEFLRFQNKRKVIGLCKNFLVLLEDVKDGPNRLTDEQYQKLRKKILDSGNDVIREFDEYTDKLDISF